MWLLTCDGDLFEGKRIWLRPGTQHILGRTTGRTAGPERIQYISHKSVSRKHLTINVGDVQAGDSSKLFTRSEIKLTDNSKIGTTLNEQKLSQETKTLDGKNYTIRLGSYEHLFHLSWQPVVLSFTSLSKKSKDPLAARREIFEQTDIKLIVDYVINETTHLISKKRNNPAALQALIQARWLLTDAFVDDLARAVLPDGGREDKASLLEQDFDANWPKETTFLVPAGQEPKPRPDSYLQPNADRAAIFQDYTLVFLAQSQYEQLLPVITAGGGKALLKDVDPNVTEVRDVVEYIKEIAGQKGSSQFKLSEQIGSGGVVVVRLVERDDASRKFWRSVDLALDQRSVEQNEFLDAILMVDASGMRRQLPEEHEDVDMNGNAGDRNSQPRSQAQPRQQEQRAVTVEDSPTAEQRPPHPQPPSEEQLAPEQQASEPPSTAARRRNRRIITQSRFKGFDDFDPSQFSRPASGSPEPPVNDSQGSGIRNMDVDEPGRTQRNTRKRPAPVAEAEGEEDMYEAILTSHAAMKRQKTQAAQNGGTDSQSKSMAESDSGAANGKKKKAKEMDVMAEVQALRKQQEEQRRQDEASLRQALPEGVDINDLKDLALVEEMELPTRERPVRNGNENGTGDRWDPAWNGRKNFKKFRRQGERQDGPRLQRVIVTLEEVPRKGHGIGDEYWLSSSATSRSKSKSQSQTQDARRGTGRSQRSGNDRDEEGEDDTTSFQRRLQKSREDEEEDAAREVMLPEEIAGRPRDEALAAAVDAARSQTTGSETQRKAAGKRPATQQSGGPSKKPRQSRLAPPPSREVLNLDDDDDDELKFRRRRR